MEQSHGPLPSDLEKKIMGEQKEREKQEWWVLWLVVHGQTSVFSLAAQFRWFSDTVCFLVCVFATAIPHSYHNLDFDVVLFPPLPCACPSVFPFFTSFATSIFPLVQGTLLGVSSSKTGHVFIYDEVKKACVLSFAHHKVNTRVGRQTSTRKHVRFSTHLYLSLSLCVLQFSLHTPAHSFINLHFIPLCLHCLLLLVAVVVLVAVLQALWRGMAACSHRAESKPKEERDRENFCERMRENVRNRTNDKQGRRKRKLTIEERESSGFQWEFVLCSFHGCRMCPFRFPLFVGCSFSLFSLHYYFLHPSLRDMCVYIQDIRSPPASSASSYVSPPPIRLCGIHSMEVCGLKWSEDGKYLATGSNDNSVSSPVTLAVILLYSLIVFSLFFLSSSLPFSLLLSVFLFLFLSEMFPSAYSSVAQFSSFFSHVFLFFLQLLLHVFFPLIPFFSFLRVSLFLSIVPFSFSLLLFFLLLLSAFSSCAFSCRLSPRPFLFLDILSVLWLFFYCLSVLFVPLHSVMSGLWLHSPRPLLLRPRAPLHMFLFALSSMQLRSRQWPGLRIRYPKDRMKQRVILMQRAGLSEWVRRERSRAKEKQPQISACTCHCWD